MKFKINVFLCFLVPFSAATDGYQIGLIGNIVANLGFVEQQRQMYQKQTGEKLC
ncbi:hypothetical protein V1527DRAFT_474885 [Lipomyces starkeyi]